MLIAGVLIVQGPNISLTTSAALSIRSSNSNHARFSPNCDNSFVGTSSFNWKYLHLYCAIVLNFWFNYFKVFK